jgi:putative peptidoglycan lipid II flippase
VLLSNNKRPIIKSALTITIIAGISALLGFVREVVIASVFGAGAVKDAYDVALRVAGTAILLSFVYMNKIFVPSYLRIREEQGDEKALGVANNALGVFLLVSVSLLILLQLAAPLIIRVIGFDAEHMPIARIAIAIAVFKLPIYAFIHFFSGYLTARKSFIGPNFMGIPLNIVTIAVCLIAGTSSGIIGLSVASLLGVVAQCLIFLVWLPKEKYRYRFSARFNTPEIRNDIKILMPALVGYAVIELNHWVDTIIATHLGEGNIAAINYAFRLPFIVQGLIVLPIAGIVYSYISDFAAKNDIESMLAMLWKAVRTIIFIIIPIVVIAMPSSLDIVRIAYERGEFTPYATALTSSALIWYLPGLPGLAVFTFLMRFFYSLQDTKTPTICSAIAICTNIALSIWLSRTMGIGGIALATAIGNTLTAVLMLALLRKKIGPLGFGQIAINLIKMTICAIPCAIAVLTARHLLSDHNAIIRFGSATIVGGTAYLATALLLKETVLRETLEMIKSWLRKADN